MANFTISPAGSKFGSATQFGKTSAVASTLTVDAGAYLISTANDGADLGGLGAWTVAVNGEIYGTTFGLMFATLSGAAAAQVTIGATGTVYGGSAAAIDSGRTVAITNNGEIFSSGFHGIDIHDSSHSTIVNNGLIAGTQDSIAIAFVGGLGNSVTNNGKMLGGVFFETGKNTLLNTGTITFDSAFGSTETGVRFGNGNDTLTNKGFINGNVLAGSGANSITNSGTIVKISGGAGVDTIVNSGKITGPVDLFIGNDIFTNTGKVSGLINMGDGNNKFTGGAFADQVQDSSGTDIFNLGGGTDVFLANGGEGDGSVDTVDGGLGRDIYDASEYVSAGVYLNFDAINHTGSGHFATPGVIGHGVATSQFDLHHDNVSGFEVAIGSDLNDVMFGSALGDTLKGGLGSDELWGMAGNDIITSGGAGAGGEDDLIGGAGADKLTGGSGFDNFIYRNASDSGTTAATRDTIIGYADGFDDITFAGTLAGKFTSLLAANEKFTGTAGELRTQFVINGQIIEGDINGDKIADMSIFVRDVAHTQTWFLSGNFLF